MHLKHLRPQSNKYSSKCYIFTLVWPEAGIHTLFPLLGSVCIVLIWIFKQIFRQFGLVLWLEHSIYFSTFTIARTSGRKQTGHQKKETAAAHHSHSLNHLSSSKCSRRFYPTWWCSTEFTWQLGGKSPKEVSSKCCGHLHCGTSPEHFRAPLSHMTWNVLM